MRAVEDGIAAGLVFESARVVTMRSDADARVGDLAADMPTAMPPLLRGKKKPFPVAGE